METKALISFAVTAKLICVFVIAYAKSRFSHDEAHLKVCNVQMMQSRGEWGTFIITNEINVHFINLKKHTS